MANVRLGSRTNEIRKSCCIEPADGRTLHTASGGQQRLLVYVGPTSKSDTGVFTFSAGCDRLRPERPRHNSPGRSAFCAAPGHVSNELQALKGAGEKALRSRGLNPTRSVHRTRPGTSAGIVGIRLVRFSSGGVRSAWRCTQLPGALQIGIQRNRHNRLASGSHGSGGQASSAI